MKRIAPIALLLVALTSTAAFAQFGAWRQDHLDTDSSLWGLWEGRMEGPAGAQLVGSSFTVRAAIKASGITTTVSSLVDGEPMWDLSVVGGQGELTGSFDAGFIPSVSPQTISDAPAAANISTDGTEYIQDATFTCDEAGSSYVSYKAKITFLEYRDWYGIIDSIVSDGSELVTHEIDLAIWVKCVDESAPKKKTDYYEGGYSDDPYDFYYPTWSYGSGWGAASGGLGYLESLDMANLEAKQAIECARYGGKTCNQFSMELGETWLERVEGCGDEQAQDQLVKRALSTAWEDFAPTFDPGTVIVDRVYTRDYTFAPSDSQGCEVPTVSPKLLAPLAVEELIELD